jgi:hypothetical protein
MVLVNSSSKAVDVIKQLLNVGGLLVFVQLIHFTDSDTFMLLLIKDFETFEMI